MKATLIALLVVVGSSFLHGTPQIPDTLHVEGVVHHVHGVVISQSMAEAYQRYREQRDVRIQHSQNWSGFRMILSLRGGALYIDKITFDFDPEASVLDVMGVEIPEQGLAASWVSEELIEYYGEQFNYSHMRSDERVFVIEKGRHVRTFDRKNKWFEERKKSKEEEPNLM